MFLFVPKKLAFITGFYSSYSAVDHFSLFHDAFGGTINCKYASKKIDAPKIYKTLETKLQKVYSKKSLEIYIIH